MEYFSQAVKHMFEDSYYDTLNDTRVIKLQYAFATILNKWVTDIARL